MSEHSHGFQRYRCLIGAAFSIGMVGSVMAVPGQPVELQADRVVLVPDSGWGFDFPAISADHQRVAVVDLAGADRREVSLNIFRVSDLALQLAFPLDSRPGGNLAACEGSEACIEEKLAEPNALLRCSGFTTMWPLYHENIRYSKPEPELIAFYNFRVLYDQERSELTIAQAIGRGIEGALMETEYQTGEIYLQQRWHKQTSSATDHSGQPCIGEPIPYAVWVNPDWMQIGPRVILVHVTYTTAEGCNFADEWFTQVIK